MLIISIRHGARYDLSELTSSELAGQLTGIGIRMSYMLGKYIRNKYSLFLPQTFNFNKNLIVSSNSQRTRQSVRSLYQGLYDYGHLNYQLEVKKKYFFPQWNNYFYDESFETPLPFGFSPIAIKTYRQDENFLFTSFYQSDCPKTIDYVNRKTTEIKELIREANVFYETLAKYKFNYHNLFKLKKISSLTQVGDIFEYLMTNKFLGNYQSVPEQIFQQTYRLYSIQTYLKFFQEIEWTQFFFYKFNQFFQDIIVQAISQLSKNKDPQYQLVTLSGHDLNLYPILILLGNVTYSCLRDQYIGNSTNEYCFLTPSFSSSFILELYQEGNQYYIGSTYNGKQLFMCQDFESKKYKDCEVNQFISVLKKKLLNMNEEQAYKKYCFQTSIKTNQYLFIVTMLIVGLILAFILITLLKNKADKIFEENL